MSFCLKDFTPEYRSQIKGFLTLTHSECMVSVIVAEMWSWEQNCSIIKDNYMQHAAFVGTSFVAFIIPERLGWYI